MKKNENKITVSVDLKVYSLEAVYGAAYLFLDKAYFYLEEEPGSKIKVNIKGKEKLTEKGINNLKDEFLNELLSSGLREKISKSNKQLREYILGRILVSALPKNDLLEEKRHLDKPKKEGVFCDDKKIKKDFTKDLPWDWEKDPEEIAIPWEKKCLNNKLSKKNDKKIPSSFKKRTKAKSKNKAKAKK